MIFFTDLDGTLLNDQKELTFENRRAIREALSQGHQVVIATGRPLCSAKRQAAKLNLTQKGCYIISFNGGELYDSYEQKSIYRKTLSFEQVRFLFDEAHRRGLHVQTYDGSHVVSEEDRPELHFYSRSTETPLLVVPDILKALPEEPCKVIVISADKNSREILSSYREEINRQVGHCMDLFFSNDFLMEHVPKNVSKGTAIRFLCDYLNIPLSETVAAGDAENDIPMLDTAGIGVAMCNAEDATKAHGDYVTKRDNNHDGVAEIIDRFILKKSKSTP